MSITIVSPNGAKVRSASQRRYVVVVEDTDTGGQVSARIEKRSDSLATLRTHNSRKGWFQGKDGVSSTYRFIFDNVTGERVR